MPDQTVRSQRVDFRRINDAALGAAHAVVRGLLPTGRIEGREWVALNPTRADAKLGSFKVNLRTGVWKDFATGDGGGDLISLVAFITGRGQREAAIALAETLGVDAFE